MWEISSVESTFKKKYWHSRISFNITLRNSFPMISIISSRIMEHKYHCFPWPWLPYFAKWELKKNRIPQITLIFSSNYHYVGNKEVPYNCEKLTHATKKMLSLVLTFRRFRASVFVYSWTEFLKNYQFEYVCVVYWSAFLQNLDALHHRFSTWR